MAYNEEKLTKLRSLKSLAQRIEAGFATKAALNALSERVDGLAAAERPVYQKADAVPGAEEAEDNVLYLVMNGNTGHYDIYAKVGTSVELLDDTTVDLSGYATSAELTEAVAGLIKLTALSVETTGEGNAVTGVAYDGATGKFTFTKGSTFLTAADVPVATDAEVTAMLTEVFGAAAE